MNTVNNKLSYTSYNCGNVAFSDIALDSAAGSILSASTSSERKADSCTLEGICSSDLLKYSGRKLMVLGPYEILNTVSRNLDGQLDSLFKDEAKYIKAIAKVRCVNDVKPDDLSKVLRGSAFSPLFASFDFEGFFSSFQIGEARFFLQKNKQSSCSFVSGIKDLDIRNRAFAEIRSKVNELDFSIRNSRYGEVWNFLNLISTYYYIDSIKFLIEKNFYSTCYAYQLFKMSSDLVYFDDGSGEGKLVSLASSKDKKFLDGLNVLHTKYA